MLDNTLLHPKCTNTSIGRLLSDLLRDSGSTKGLSPYLLTSLLLAEIELEDTIEKRNLLRQVLGGTYGDSIEWSPYTELLPLSVQERIVETLTDVESYPSPRVRAYIQGIIGFGSFETTDVSSRAIYRRQRRVFHRELPQSKNTTKKSAQIICLLGFKASGKSSVMDALSGRKETTLELYKELKLLKERQDSRVTTLPPAALWTSEPLELVLEERKIVTNMPERLFVGSILRQEEVDMLREIAPVKCIALHCPNNVRHQRARSRGRLIERDAHDSWLIELDAHRAGEWPTYETNDVSTLMANADVSLNSTNDITADHLADEILQLLLSK